MCFFWPIKEISVFFVIHNRKKKNTNYLKAFILISFEPSIYRRSHSVVGQFSLNLHRYKNIFFSVSLLIQPPRINEPLNSQGATHSLFYTYVYN